MARLHAHIALFLKFTPNSAGTFRQSLKFRRWFDVESTSKFRRRIFNAFSTPNKKLLKYRRRINVEIPTTVEISTLFRRPSKYSYVFQRFYFDVDSTLIQRRKCPLGSYCKADIPPYTKCLNVLLNILKKNQSTDFVFFLCLIWSVVTKLYIPFLFGVLRSLPIIYLFG